MILYQAFQDIAPFMSQASAPEGSFSPFSNAQENTGSGSFRQGNAGSSLEQENTDGNSRQDDIGGISGQDDNGGSSRQDGFASGFAPNADMLFSMLSPEQQEMFQNIKAVMDTATDTPQENG